MTKSTLKGFQCRPLVSEISGVLLFLRCTRMEAGRLNNVLPVFLQRNSPSPRDAKVRTRTPDTESEKKRRKEEKHDVIVHVRAPKSYPSCACNILRKIQFEVPLAARWRNVASKVRFVFQTLSSKNECRDSNTPFQE